MWGPHNSTYGLKTRFLLFLPKLGVRTSQRTSEKISVSARRKFFLKILKTEKFAHLGAEKLRILAQKTLVRQMRKFF